MFRIWMFSQFALDHLCVNLTAKNYPVQRFTSQYKVYFDNFRLFCREVNDDGKCVHSSFDGFICFLREFMGFNSNVSILMSDWSFAFLELKMGQCLVFRVPEIQEGKWSKRSIKLDFSKIEFGKEIASKKSVLPFQIHQNYRPEFCSLHTMNRRSSCIFFLYNW